MIVDHLHYVAQFMWVGGNLAWSAGELFTDEDEVMPLRGSRKAVVTARFYSSWILILSLAPIVVLYFVWFLMTCFGMILEDEEGKGCGTPGEDASQMNPLHSSQDAPRYQERPEMGEVKHSSGC